MIAKTDDEIRREDRAHAVNEGLVGTHIRVTAGGKVLKGYEVTMAGLTERGMREVVGLLRAYLDVQRGQG